MQSKKIMLKTRLLRRGLSVKALAEQLGRPRPSVSMAINRGRHPLLLKKIEEALNVR